MATRGGSGQLLEIIRDGGQGNARLGQTLVLFGLLSVVGGLGLFVLTETFPFDPDAARTYRLVALGVAGYGLPAFLLGLVVVAGGRRREVRVTLVGGLLSTFAVVLFLAAYFELWDVLARSVYVVAALAVYALGTLFCVVGGGGAIRLEADPDADEVGSEIEIEIESESEFIWGEPPEE